MDFEEAAELYLWTVQSRQVLKIIFESGEYFPDFDKSSGYGGMKQTYPTLLDRFNNLNQSTFRGFVFCFYGFIKRNGLNDSGNQEFKTIDDLYHYLADNLDVMKAFNFWSQDYAIIQFATDKKFKIMPMDFNDVIKLNMWETKDFKRIQMLYRANNLNISILEFKRDLCKIYNGMNSGNLNPYTSHPSFIEGHYPHLLLKDIRGIYPNLNYTAIKNTGEMVCFDLPSEAQQLRSKIENII